MRIALDFRPVTAAPRSGMARQALAMEAALRQRPGTEVLLCTAAPADHPHRQFALCPAAPSPIDGLHRLGERLRFEWRFLPRTLAARDVDVYIATINMGLPPRLGNHARRVLLLHDVFQLTLRNRHGSPLKEAVYRLTDWLGIAYSVRAADAIWVPSAYTARELAERFPAAAAKVRVLPNAVPQSPWRDGPQRVPAGLPLRYWLVVGTREPRKNIAWFVQAWRNARRLAPDSVPPLVLVGHPADLPGTHDDLTWLTDLDDAELRATLRGAERLWHPSYAEGFGLPVIEAAACGTPVATALGTALDEVTPPGSPRFDAHDGPGLTALMQALAEPVRRRGEGLSELRDWARRFDAPAYRERLDALVGELA